MSKETQAAMLKQLKNPFDPKFIKWRVGATNKDKTQGIALAYLDSREVMKRLDDVCGLGGWRDRFIEVKDGFIAEIDIKIDGEWVTRSNTAGNTKVEPIKGGASDSFKRAASTWGIGRYLYYLPNVWVPIKQFGNSYALVPTPKELADSLPDWALPGHVERWEDVAELEVDVNSGADEAADMLITNVDNIRAATTEKELDEVVKKLQPDERVILVNQINAKRRELVHASKIDSDNTGSPSA